MITVKMPDEYLKSQFSWNWKCVALAYSIGLVSHSQAVMLSKSICANRPDFDSDSRARSILDSSENSQIAPYLNSLSKDEVDDGAMPANEFLANVFLTFIKDRIMELDDPLGIIESVYAELDYPKKIAPYVRYMPFPGSNSEQDIIERLIKYNGR